MNMNTGAHRSQSAVPDPDWFARNSTRLKPASPSTETTVIDDMASLGGSLTSLNLDSINFDFENLAAASHYSTRSMPAIMATDAPWNESPRSLRSAAPASARRLAALNVRPPGISPLDHLQNSLSSINTGSRSGPPVRHVITEDDEEQDMTDLNESIASLVLENLVPVRTNSGDMDATAHAGNITRGRETAHQRISRPPVSSAYSPIRQHRPAVMQSPRNLRNVENQEPSISLTDEEDDDNIEIIKLLRRQVQTLKTQLAEEQSKTLRAIMNNPATSNDNSYRSFQGSVASSSCVTNDDDDDSGFALPNTNLSDGTSATGPKSNVVADVAATITNIFGASMQAMQTLVHALDKPGLDEKDKKLLLEELQTNFVKLDQDQEKLVREHTQTLKEKSKLSHKVEEQDRRIKELEQQLKLLKQQ